MPKLGTTRVENPYHDRLFDTNGTPPKGQHRDVGRSTSFTNYALSDTPNQFCELLIPQLLRESQHNSLGGVKAHLQRDRKDLADKTIFVIRLDTVATVVEVLPPGVGREMPKLRGGAGR